MSISPLLRQLIVAGSTHLAALSAGGVIAYPGVLLQQLQTNDTIIQLDLHNGSWIGSVHGIAGIPSILLPFLMQCKGRKFAFVLSCIFITTGWIFTYFAQNITTLIIGECFHGLGGNSLLAVSFLSISEMVQPKYRNVCLSLYGTVQALGISLVGILGRFLHWKIVSLIMCMPVLLALPIGCLWLDSPSWLACKRRFSECKNVFEKLRGTDQESKSELKAMIRCKNDDLDVNAKSTEFRRFFINITNRDFYIPALHTFVLISVIYWGGGMPVIIYANDMILKLTGKTNLQMRTMMDCTLFIGYNVSTVLLRYCSSKKVLLFSMCSSTIFMSSAAFVIFLQIIGTLSNDSESAVYLLLGFVIFFSLGANGIGFVIASEIMPVKHRGIGGCFYIVCTCILHSFSLKTYPYLYLWINIWGVFLVYAAYNFFSILFIWKYVPDTKNKTLQEIEQFYTYGFFKTKIENENVHIPFIREGKH